MVVCQVATELSIVLTIVYRATCPVLITQFSKNSPIAAKVCPVIDSKSNCINFNTKTDSSCSLKVFKCRMKSTFIANGPKYCVTCRM